jgi:hypothetical protein
VTTFAIMQARIADDIVRDDLAAQIENAINDAIELQEGERYAFNERRYRILTVANQEYYDLAAPTLLDENGGVLPTGEALIELDDITALVSNNPYPLRQRTQQHINEWQTTTHRGQPADYALYSRQLRISPIPDAVYQLNPMGLARLGPNPLAGDADTNAWMTDGAAIIRAQAKVLIYRDILRDAEGVALAREQIIEAGGNPNPGAAKRKMAAQACTGRMRPWSL